MQLDTITMDPKQARRKITAYRGRCVRDANKEYAAALRGYEELEKGAILISLSQTIAKGGWDDEGRPRLAVARADKRRTRFTYQRWNKRILFESHDQWARAGRLTSIRLPTDGMAERPETESSRAEAIVPLIPPDVMPRVNCDLTKRLVLFEADWKNVPLDPALLRPLAGDLYVVEAVWDLTELERLVIAGR